VASANCSPPKFGSTVTMNNQSDFLPNNLRYKKLTDVA